MITEFEDFCLWVYVVVDDIWKRLGPLLLPPWTYSLWRSGCTSVAL